MSISSDAVEVLFGPAQGFHPTMQIKIKLSKGTRRTRLPRKGIILDSDTRNPATFALERPLCDLFVSLHLPSAVFVDPYELDLRKQTYDAYVQGETNLELPVHEMTGRGQDVLLRIVLPSELETSKAGIEEARGVNVHFDLPLHLRYAQPRRVLEGDEHNDKARVNWPDAFWACPPDGGTTGGAANHSFLPEATQLLLDDTDLFRIPPNPNSLADAFYLSIPMGNTNDMVLVETGTATVLLLCFIYIAFIGCRAARRLDRSKHEKAKLE